MDVRILETGEVKTLRIFNRDTWTDWAEDLIGNAGALNDGQFILVDDELWTSRDTYEWWEKYIYDREQTEFDVDALAEELGIDRNIIAERVQAYQGCDYEDHRRMALKALREIREEYEEGPQVKMTMREIIEQIVANAAASSNEELEVQFEFYATENGWTDQEIQEALNSPWFPWIGR